MSLEERQHAASANAAGPNTLLGLHLSIKSRMGEVAAEFSGLRTKAGEQRAPLVLDFFVPPKLAADDPDFADYFPFIIVRPREGADTEQGADEDARATVDLVVGTYSDDDEGGHDVLNVVEAIRRSVHEAPILEDYFGTASAFEHVGPLRWQTDEKNLRPQWLATVTTIWQLPRPRRVEARNPT